MWKTLKDCLESLTEAEEISFVCTPEEKVSDQLMISIRKKAYTDVLDLMTRIEVDSLNALCRDFQSDGKRTHRFSLS